MTDNKILYILEDGRPKGLNSGTGTVEFSMLKVTGSPTGSTDVMTVGAVTPVVEAEVSTRMAGMSAIQGATGIQGITGTQGIQGDQGVTGLGGQGFSLASYDPSITATTGVIGEVLDETDAAQLWIKQDSGQTTNWKPLDWTVFKTGYSGWATTSGITLSLSGTGNKTLTISGTRTFYVLGRPFTKTVDDSLDMDTFNSGLKGIRFFSYNSAGTFQQSTSTFDFVNEAPVAVAYWAGTSGHSLGWELHGLVDAADHSYKHLTIGMRFISGFQQTSTPLASGVPSSDAQTYMWLTGGGACMTKTSE